MRSRRLNLDLALDDEDNPAVGDVLVSARCAYRVWEARPVDSRLWGNRWALTLRPLGPHHREPPEPAPGGRRWYSKPYRRGEKPADHFGPPAPADPAAGGTADPEEGHHAPDP